MDFKEVEVVELPSGFKVPISNYMYDNYFREFTETQLFSFNNYINAGSYFPQIVQFALVLTAILNGRTGLKDILFCSIGTGVAFMLFWFWFRCYKIPMLAFFTCLIGGNIFRLNLHFLAIVAVALLVLKDWKVVLFCFIGAVVSSIIRSLLFGRMTKVKYVDGIVRYVSGFKYKE